MPQHYESQLTARDLANIDALVHISARHDTEGEADWPRHLISGHLLAYAAHPRSFTAHYADMRRTGLFENTLPYRVTTAIIDLCAPHFSIISRLPQPDAAIRSIIRDDPDYRTVRLAWMHTPNDPDLYRTMRAHELIALIDVRTQALINTKTNTV